MAARLTRICRRTTSIFLQPHRTLTGNGSTTEDPPPVLPQKREVNKAMKAYLERAHEHELFMKVQNYEFQIGKRHLANMMGENPETFSQTDVDNAIEYLFPSGLYEKKARPFMKPPEEVFPKRKAAEFNEHGKPHHYLFYTGKPNFYKVMYDIVENINELNKFEDVMLRKNKLADPNLKLELSGYKWVECHVLANQLVENITEKEYDNFIVAMERLVAMPYAYKYKDFLLKYTRPLMTQSSTYEVPKLHYDATGRGYITTYECVRKRAKGHVTLSTPGSGKIAINGQDITYFEHLQNREQVSAKYYNFMALCAPIPRYTTL